jgi:hypothetical protein
MKTRIVLAVVIVLVAIVLAYEAHGQGTGFVIERADARADISTTASSTLNSLIANVNTRFVTQYANAVRYYNVTPISSELSTLLGQAADRFVVQYANANQFYTLSYPVALVSDNTPPQLSGIITSRGIAVDSVAILWTTSEFATSEVLYGTQSGVYPQTKSDSLYAKQHEVTLTGLTPDTVYYYKVRSVDRSNNTFTSSENTFTAKRLVYLPLILRNSQQ